MFIFVLYVYIYIYIYIYIYTHVFPIYAYINTGCESIVFAHLFGRPWSTFVRISWVSARWHLGRWPWELAFKGLGFRV